MRYTQAHNALKPNGFEILLCCINPQPCDDDGLLLDHGRIRVVSSICFGIEAQLSSRRVEFLVC